MEQANKTEKLLIIIVAAILLVQVAYGAYPLLIHNTGNVQSTPDLSTTTSTLDWGSLQPGSSQQKQFNVTNEGNVPLTLQASAVSLPSYLSFSAAFSPTAVNPGESSTCTVTLTVADSATPTTFGFDIQVQGA